MKLEVLEILNLIITHVIFIGTLGFYLIVNLQWYHYKISRVLTKHHKIEWHFLYFVLPTTLYFFSWDSFFWIFFYFGYIPSLYLWYKKLDKKLVFTMRVKRFLGLLLFLTIFQDLICLLKEACQHFGIFMPIIMTVFGSIFVEKFIFISYYNQARNKLSKMPDLKIIAITGSYGKTSIKNFLAQILSKKFKVYHTPRSVNTLEGIVKDINDNLGGNIQIYIVEAGAREKRDILKIARLLQHDIGIVGKIGEQHIEYFKTLSNIIQTKLEIIESDRLEELYLHHSINKEKVPQKNRKFKIIHFGKNISGVKSTLDGTWFNYIYDNNLERFQTKVLGKFQGENLAVVIDIALRFGFNISEIKFHIQNLKPIPHRLEKIEVEGKIIIDDGYNSNLEGMLEAFRLVESYSGRKIVITPGLIESNYEMNERIAFELDDIFDIVIITGVLNHDFFKRKLVSTKSIKIFLKDKSKLEKVLTKQTKKGDIILFANDAPNFI